VRQGGLDRLGESLPPTTVASAHEGALCCTCAQCQQIFWPGEKYETTMEGLRAEGKETTRAEGVARAGAATSDVQPGDMVVEGTKVATSMWFREK
jgi:hypothetical protein